MFEYIVDKDKEIQKLSQEQESNVVSNISQNFQEWDDIRQDQKDRYNLLKPEMYLQLETKEDTWKSKKRMNKIYSLFQTRQAFLWENIFSNIDKMFSVEGATPESEQYAKYQKAMLVDAFDKMELNKHIDKAVEYLDTVGEMCLFTCWKSRTKQEREKQTVINQITGLPETQTVVVDKEIYNGAYVDTINPLNLVFDPSVNPDITDEWDSCGKIIKTFQTYDAISKNKAYKLNKSQLLEIKDKLTPNANKNNEEVNDDVDKIDDVIDDDKIEVLEYWGDFYVDGQLLKNWSIAVIGRQFLARFIANPFIINPIINVATLRNPDNYRGIQTLYSIYDLAKTQEDDINETKDVQQLNKNPARFAPDNFFKEDEIEISPGKVIKYKQGIDDPNAIIPIVVPLMDANTQINYLDSTISNVSGIFPNMQGNDETGSTTATEIKVKVQGQTTRLQKDIDTIKQNGIVKMVENVADLIANENIGEISTLMINDNGNKTSVMINDLVRKGSYEYKYSDNTAIANKRQQFTEALGLFEKMAAVPNINLNFKEILKTGLELLGFENTNKFFLQQQEIMNNGQGIAPAGVPSGQVIAGNGNY